MQTFPHVWLQIFLYDCKVNNCYMHTTFSYIWLHMAPSFRSNFSTVATKHMIFFRRKFPPNPTKQGLGQAATTSHTVPVSAECLLTKSILFCWLLFQPTNNFFSHAKPAPATSCSQQNRVAELYILRCQTRPFFNLLFRHRLSFSLVSGDRNPIYYYTFNF